MGNLLYCLIYGCIGAYIAKRKKLNPFFWFFMSSMWGLLPILGFIFIPIFFKKKKKTAPPTEKPAPLPFPAESVWYYLDVNDTQMGPMSFLKLQEMKQDGKLSEETYIWNEAFDHWKQWKSVFPSENPKE